MKPEDIYKSGNKSYGEKVIAGLIRKIRRLEKENEKLKKRNKELLVALCGKRDLYIDNR